MPTSCGTPVLYKESIVKKIRPVNRCPRGCSGFAGCKRGTGAQSARPRVASEFNFSLGTAMPKTHVRLLACGMGPPPLPAVELSVTRPVLVATDSPRLVLSCSTPQSSEFWIPPINLAALACTGGRSRTPQSPRPFKGTNLTLAFTRGPRFGPAFETWINRTQSALQPVRPYAVGLWTNESRRSWTGTPLGGSTARSSPRTGPAYGVVVARGSSRTRRPTLAKDVARSVPNSMVMTRRA